MCTADFRDACVEFLRQEGYRPELDEDGDIRFQHEGLTFFIMQDGSDPQFVQLLLPNIRRIERPEEQPDIIRAAENATRKTKVAKVYLIRDGVFASFETFLASPAAGSSFCPVLARAIRTLRAAARVFSEYMEQKAARHVGLA